MPRSLMLLFHSLANEGNKEVIPVIEKALVDHPGAGFLFLPVRDGLDGWLFLMVFVRGFHALPDAVKTRHAPFQPTDRADACPRLVLAHPGAFYGALLHRLWFTPGPV